MARRAIYCSAVAFALLGMVLFALLEFDGRLRKYFPPSSFTVDKIPSLKGKVVLITGANVGLGKETALQLAKKGAKLVLACRSTCEPVAEQIRKSGGDATAMSLDLGDSKSIYKFASEYRAKNLPIHILILNAGVMMIPKFTTTKDGLEAQLGVNWIGHFYLQHLLQDIVEASAPSRIVILTSKGHIFVTEPVKSDLPVEDTPENRAKYNPVTNYGYSKLANILHAKELDARLKAQGKKVEVIAVHPGSVDTELSRYVVDEIRPIAGDTFVNLAIKFFQTFMTLSVHDGAITQIWAATSPEITEMNLSGSYAVPMARVIDPSPNALDENLRKRAWAQATEIIKRFSK